MPMSGKCQASHLGLDPGDFCVAVGAPVDGARPLAARVEEDGDVLRQRQVRHLTQHLTRPATITDITHPEGTCVR